MIRRSIGRCAPGYMPARYYDDYDQSVDITFVDTQIAPRITSSRSPAVHVLCKCEVCGDVMGSPYGLLVHKLLHEVPTDELQYDHE